LSVGKSSAGKYPLDISSSKFNNHYRRKSSLSRPWLHQNQPYSTS